jgi:hypothetical protein
MHKYSLIKKIIFQHFFIYWRAADMGPLTHKKSREPLPYEKLPAFFLKRFDCSQQLWVVPQRGDNLVDSPEEYKWR